MDEYFENGYTVQDGEWVKDTLDAEETQESLDSTMAFIASRELAYGAHA